MQVYAEFPGGLFGKREGDAAVFIVYPFSFGIPKLPDNIRIETANKTVEFFIGPLYKSIAPYGYDPALSAYPDSLPAEGPEVHPMVGLGNSDQVECVISERSVFCWGIGIMDIGVLHGPGQLLFA